MSDCEEVRAVFAVWVGANDVEWEMELSVHRDGDRAPRHVTGFEGSGQLEGSVLETIVSTFERYCYAIAQAKGLQVELDLFTAFEPFFRPPGDSGQAGAT